VFFLVYEYKDKTNYFNNKQKKQLFLFGNTNYLYIFVADYLTIKSNQKHNDMKNTQLTTNEDRSERLFLMLVFVGILIAGMLISAINL